MTKSTKSEVSEKLDQPILGSHLNTLFWINRNRRNNLSINQPGEGETADQLLRKIIDNKAAINREFDEITWTAVGSSDVFKKASPSKIRSKTTPCLDDTRVAIKELSNADFIHANFVDGFKHGNTFICCQAPLEKTITDFWHMIWQEEVIVIAMLENKKYDLYWPNTKSDTMKHDPYFIQCDNTVVNKTYTFTTMTIVRDDKPSQKRTVFHVMLHDWVEKGIPKNCTTLLSFIDVIRNTQEVYNYELKPSQTPSIVIHGTMGIGRTGTFTVINNCMLCLLETGKTDIKKTVQNFRKQRANGVETFNQYLFIYCCVVMFALTNGMFRPAYQDAVALGKLLEELKSA